jgi:hypothetical protein
MFDAHVDSRVVSGIVQSAPTIIQGAKSATFIAANRPGLPGAPDRSSMLIGLLLASAIGWDVRVTKDAMSDRNHVQAILENEQGSISYLCGQGESGALVLVQPNAFLGGRMAGYELRDTTFRFDDAPPTL